MFLLDTNVVSELRQAKVGKADKERGVLGALGRSVSFLRVMEAPYVKAGLFEPAP